MLKGRYVKNTAWLVGNKVAQMLIGLLVNIFVTRYLGSTNYGTINYVLSYITFFSTLCGLGLSNIIVKELVSNPNSQGEVLGSAIGIRFIASVISQACFIGMMFFIGKEDKTIFIVAIVQSFSLVFNSFDLINHWYLSKLMAKRNAIISFVAYILTAIYRIILLALKMSVAWFASAYILDVLSIAIMLVIFYHVDKGQKLKFSFRRVKDLLKKSYHFILSGLMVVIYSQTDKIMIGNMLSVDAVGIYTLAISTISLWQFIPIALIDSARPIIFERYSDDGKDWIRYLRYLYVGIIWLCILYGIFIVIFAKLIINILYGKEFLGSVPVMRLAVWYMSFSYIGSCKNIYLIACGNQKYEKYFTLCGCLINVGLNFLFIPKFGIIGATFATLITQIITNVLMPLIFKGSRLHSIIFFQSIVFYGVLWGKDKLSLQQIKSMLPFKKKLKKSKNIENELDINKEEVNIEKSNECIIESENKRLIETDSVQNIENLNNCDNDIIDINEDEK